MIFECIALLSLLTATTVGTDVRDADGLFKKDTQWTSLDGLMMDARVATDTFDRGNVVGSGTGDIETGIGSGIGSEEEPEEDEEWEQEEEEQQEEEEEEEEQQEEEEEEEEQQEEEEPEECPAEALEETLDSLLGDGTSDLQLQLALSLSCNRNGFCTAYCHHNGRSLQKTACLGTKPGDTEFDWYGTIKGCSKAALKLLKYFAHGTPLVAITIGIDVLFGVIDAVLLLSKLDEASIICAAHKTGHTANLATSKYHNALDGRHSINDKVKGQLELLGMFNVLLSCCPKCTLPGATTKKCFVCMAEGFGWPMLHEDAAAFKSCIQPLAAKALEEVILGINSLLKEVCCYAEENEPFEGIDEEQIIANCDYICGLKHCYDDVGVLRCCETDAGANDHVTLEHVELECAKCCCYQTNTCDITIPDGRTQQSIYENCKASGASSTTHSDKKCRTKLFHNMLEIPCH